MDSIGIEQIRSRQAEFFATGQTRDLKYRRNSLRALLRALDEREPAILQALNADLGRPPFEAFVSELGFVKAEVKHAIRSLKRWAKPRRVPTPLRLMPGRSQILFEPKGLTLIMGPWNYPFQLLMAPLVGALAAGNCAILKPSEFAPAIAEEIRQIVSSVFEEGHVSVVEGDASVAQELLRHRWDHVFFTGGTETGKKVMEACAKTLSPATLELGGKSPCIIDRDIDLVTAARRVAWGKFMNCGQTCIAPDYLLVHREIKAGFVAELKRAIADFYGMDPLASPSYGRIISRKHCERLAGFLGDGEVVEGGRYDLVRRYFAPTILTDVGLDCPVMKEEIFGPVLPILEFSDVQEAKAVILRNPRPLALYVFTRDKRFERDIISTVPFGGGCVNDVVLQIANPHLPFGGIGESGMGAYHGELSFEVFSHSKALVRKPFWLDLRLRYPPYTEIWKRLKWLFS